LLWVLVAVAVVLLLVLRVGLPWGRKDGLPPQCSMPCVARAAVCGPGLRLGGDCWACPGVAGFPRRIGNARCARFWHRGHPRGGAAPGAVRVACRVG
jgi:hypothetical protein